MVVPLLSGDEVQGAMAVWRTGGSPFEPHELEFLVGLSLQAAVALQNARLFNETSEALERQTASAEVLQVISGSMADPKPVFDKILDSCARLFGAGDPAVCLVDGDLLRIGAYRGKFTEEVEQAFPRPLAGHDQRHGDPAGVGPVSPQRARGARHAGLHPWKSHAGAATSPS